MGADGCDCHCAADKLANVYADGRRRLGAVVQQDRMLRPNDRRDLRGVRAGRFVAKLDCRSIVRDRTLRCFEKGNVGRQDRKSEFRSTNVETNPNDEIRNFKQLAPRVLNIGA